MIIRSANNHMMVRRLLIFDIVLVGIFKMQFLNTFLKTQDFGVLLAVSSDVDALVLHFAIAQD